MALSGCDGKKTGSDTQEPAATAPSTATPSPPAVADPGATRPLLNFAGMDSDGDGAVSSAEHAKASQAIYQAMDLDTNGAVMLAEMDAARDAIGERPELSSEKLIEAADSDHDGKLTLGEWVASSNARFAGIDADRDGFLNPAEWQRGVAAETPLQASGAEPRKAPR